MSITEKFFLLILGGFIAWVFNARNQTPTLASVAPSLGFASLPNAGASAYIQTAVAPSIFAADN